MPRGSKLRLKQAIAESPNLVGRTWFWFVLIKPGRPSHSALRPSMLGAKKYWPPFIVTNEANSSVTGGPGVP
jgi:hypothetical protein